MPHKPLAESTLVNSQGLPAPGNEDRLAILGVHQRIRLDRRSWLKQELLEDRGIDVDRCLECGKCTGGCPSGYMFDYAPRQIVQLVKLDALDTLLAMDSLSACLGCRLCTDRCPAAIDAAGLIDYFRERTREQGGSPMRTDANLFNEIFLAGVRSRGRISEFSLMLRFNVKTSRYLQGASLGGKLLAKGKLRLRSSKVKDRAALGRLFGQGVSQSRTDNSGGCWR